MSQNNELNRKNKSNHHQHYQNHLRQDFDDNNADMDTSGSSSNKVCSEQMPSPKDFRILRCFCGCSQLTFEQIESYAMMNVKGILQNDDSKQLFETFLKIGHRTDKSNAKILLECYELSNRILSDLDSHQKYLSDLIEVCPSFLWEQKINDACEADTTDEINRQLEEVLNALKKECLCNIESDHDFIRFRRELLRKIGK